MAGVAGFSGGRWTFGERQENRVAPNRRKLAVALSATLRSPTVEKFFKTVAQDEDWDDDPHPSSAFTLVDPTRLRACRSLARGHRGSN
jgi:hypothetical protein